MPNVWISWSAHLCRCFSLGISLPHTLYSIYCSDRRYLNFIGHVAIVVLFHFCSFGENSANQIHQLNKYICLWISKIWIINFIYINSVKLTHHMKYYFPFSFSLMFYKGTVLSISWAIRNIWLADFVWQPILKLSLFSALWLGLSICHKYFVD